MTEQPGAPPESPEGTSQEEALIQFSFADLQFIGSSVANNREFLCFMVAGEFALLIEKFEYFAYVEQIIRLTSSITEKEAIVDWCIPDYEEITEGIPEMKSNITEVSLQEDGTTKTKEKTIAIKWYNIFNLVDCLDILTENE